VGNAIFQAIAALLEATGNLDLFNLSHPKSPNAGNIFNFFYLGKMEYPSSSPQFEQDGLRVKASKGKDGMTWDLIIYYLHSNEMTCGK